MTFHAAAARPDSASAPTRYFAFLHDALKFRLRFMIFTGDDAQRRRVWSSVSRLVSTQRRPRFASRCCDVAGVFSPDIGAAAHFSAAAMPGYFWLARRPFGRHGFRHHALKPNFLTLSPHSCLSPFRRRFSAKIFRRFSRDKVRLPGRSQISARGQFPEARARYFAGGGYSWRR